MTANLSSRARIAIGAGALVLAVVVLWFLVVSPKRARASELETEVATARTELAQRKAELAQPSAAVTVRASDVFRLAKALPEDSNVAGVLLEVDNLAKSHGLSLEGFQPTAVVPVTGYYAQPVTVTVQGRFGDVSRFLGDMRQLVRVKNGRLVVDGRLYSVTEVRLGKPEGEVQYPVVRASLVLNAFGLMPGAPVTPTPEADSTTPSSDGTSAAGATP